MNNKKFNFEEDYFEGYYKNIADFTLKRNNKLTNWFRGIYEYINHYYAIKNGKGKKVIEFGCATGAAASVLRDFGWDVTATDVSKYAVKKAKKIYKEIKFMVQDMERPFRGEKFDLAVAFDVIEHLPNPETGIQNIYKLLKKDGAVICTTPNKYPHVSNDPTHINVKRPQEWKKIFRNIGFRNIFMKQITLMPYFYRWHWRLFLAIPVAIKSPYFISPVVIIAKK